jgi:hypothetical protein
MPKRKSQSDEALTLQVLSDVVQSVPPHQTTKRLNISRTAYNTIIRIAVDARTADYVTGRTRKIFFLVLERLRFAQRHALQILASSKKSDGTKKQNVSLRALDAVVTIEAAILTTAFRLGIVKPATPDHLEESLADLLKRELLSKPQEALPCLSPKSSDETSSGKSPAELEEPDFPPDDKTP